MASPENIEGKPEIAIAKFPAYGSSTFKAFPAKGNPVISHFVNKSILFLTFIQ
jgi:hypothetical protein